jgi:hypothetical protein
MSEQINNNRRRFLRNAAMAIPAADLVMMSTSSDRR